METTHNSPAYPEPDNAPAAVAERTTRRRRALLNLFVMGFTLLGFILLWCFGFEKESEPMIYVGLAGYLVLIFAMVVYDQKVTRYCPNCRKFLWFGALASKCPRCKLVLKDSSSASSS